MIRIKNISSLLFLFIIWNCSIAQNLMVNGTVNSNNQIISQAEIIVVETQRKTLTDSLGNFLLYFDKAGNYTISVFKQNFQTEIKRIKITSKNAIIPLNINFDIKPFEQNLSEVTVASKKDNNFGISQLKSVEGTAIYAGKKSEVIDMDNVAANKATNNSRQIYAKVAGLNIWENDGAGIQLGIGGRGLNPNRVSNFNTRQNGYDMSADALGYPESYYSPPAEAIERIEIVRGAASLQYGTQFGGFINFKLKDGNENKKLELISRQTVGSFGFFNTFNSIGGKSGKWKYYTFYQYKTGNGWRENSEFNVQTAHANLRYQINPKMEIGVEYTYMHYLAHQAGGLTDRKFQEDPQQSIRDRNWFQVDWNLAAINYNYKINDRTTLNSRTFSLVAGRDALGFLGSINRVDPLGERNLLKDDFTNFGSEVRLIHRYDFIKNTSIILVGARYYHGFTDRKQGNGSDGNDANFSYLRPNNLEHSDYDFPSQNVALFAENIFYLSKKWSVTPGLRFEYIDTRSKGYYKVKSTDLAGNILFENNIQDNRNNNRNFILAGIGTSYKTDENLEYYANFSQNYRSINFNDMRIVNPNAKVDPNLKDETGYSADIGLRGNYKGIIYFDFSAFLLSYNNRIGSILVQDQKLFNYYQLRTNISDSKSYGIETFFEVDLFKLTKINKPNQRLSVFSNFSLMDAKYINSENSAIDGNKVELVPPIIFKTGISYTYKRLKLNYQFSYTQEHFTDATNSISTAEAVNGIIPSYSVMDFTASYQFKKYFSLSSGINNLLNSYYFTRRAAGYPVRNYSCRTKKFIFNTPIQIINN